MAINGKMTQITLIYDKLMHHESFGHQNNARKKEEDLLRVATAGNS